MTPPHIDDANAPLCSGRFVTVASMIPRGSSWPGLRSLRGPSGIAVTLTDLRRCSRSVMSQMRTVSRKRLASIGWIGSAIGTFFGSA